MKTANTHSLSTQALIWFSAILLSFSVLAPQQALASDELLEVDQAFELQQPKFADGKLIVEWKIADGYKLYKDKMSVKASNIALQMPQYSAYKTVDDPLFGKSDVFANKAVITTDYSGQGDSEITVNYQGCSEKLGVCYPPQTRTFKLNAPAIKAGQDQAPASFGSLNELNKYLTADSGQDELLDADDAFTFSAKQDGNQLIINWSIAPNYHLYRDKIKVKTLQGDIQHGELQLPEATLIDDELFGKTHVFHGDIEAVLPLNQAAANSIIEFEYQGCSASNGVCYPPAKKQVDLSAVSATNGAQIANAVITDSTSGDQSESDMIADTLKNSSVWIVIATFLVFGLLLSLTPCVFPMIPILSSIIVGQGDQLTTKRAFIMSLVYVLAMSVTYTIAGVLAGVFGENLQVAFQNPWIIGSFSIIFLLLALSMFGFYELQLPSALQSKLTNISNKQQGGTLTGVAVMGFLSALIVGPCVAPPLAGALIYIGQTGDALLGGLALFAMSMGMGLPLLLLGTSAGKLLPRAGVWMDNVKAVFGVMLIAIAIWMAERIIPVEAAMLSWAMLLMISAVYMGAFSSTQDTSGWFRLSKGLGLVLFFYGAAILIGLLGGSKQMFQPLQVFQGGGTVMQQQTDKLAFSKIKSIDDLNAELAKGKPVMLDFYADWCISCKEMEALTFSKAKVHQALEGVTLLKADVTANDAIDKALMKQFGIIGPPAILFFNTEGTEQKAQRVVGFKNADDFTTIINQAFNK